jgi:hypothetical protein
MGIEEGEEEQAKGMHNTFNKIITENFPNLEKTIPIQVQEASRTPNRLDQNRTTSRHIIIKTTSTENRKRKKHTNNWKVNNTLPNDHWAIDEIKEEIKRFLEVNENENMAY